MLWQSPLNSLADWRSHPVFVPASGTTSGDLLRSRIGAGLRDSYRETFDEALPNHLAALCERLENGELGQAESNDKPAST